METFDGWMTYHTDDITSTPKPLDDIPVGGYRFTRAIRNDEGGFSITWREWEDTGGIIVSSQDGVRYTGRYDYLPSGETGSVDLRLYQGKEVRIVLFGRWDAGEESRFWMFQLNPAPQHVPESEPVTALPQPKRKTTPKPKRKAVAKTKPKVTAKTNRKATAKPKATVKARAKSKRR